MPKTKKNSRKRSNARRRMANDLVLPHVDIMPQVSLPYYGQEHFPYSVFKSLSINTDLSAWSPNSMVLAFDSQFTQLFSDVRLDYVDIWIPGATSNDDASYVKVEFPSYRFIQDAGGSKPVFSQDSSSSSSVVEVYTGGSLPTWKRIRPPALSDEWYRSSDTVTTLFKVAGSSRSFCVVWFTGR